MKLLLTVLLLAVSLCNGQQYVNFVPVGVDADGYCSNNIGSLGLGYSILIGKCFTLDNLYSHMLVGNAENGTLAHNTYNVGKNGFASCTGTPSSIDTLYIQDCTTHSDFNSYFSDMETTFNVNISVSEYSSFDELPPNTYINSYTSGGCGSSNTPYLLEYMVGGLTTGEGSTTVTFFCNDNVPLMQTCKEPPILSFNNNNLQSCQTKSQLTNCQSIPKTNNYLSVSCSSN